MSLMYSVNRVQLSELPCGIPSLRHSFVDVTPSIWVAIVLPGLPELEQLFPVITFWLWSRRKAQNHLTI